VLTTEIAEIAKAAAAAVSPVTGRLLQGAEQPGAGQPLVYRNVDGLP
jgi:hypothetical protein